jgi:ribosome biogenesis GTPase
VIEGTVVRCYSDFADVALDPKAGTAPVIATARLRGRLAKRVGTDKNVLAVGDRVILENPGHEWIVEDILPRRTKFSRRHPSQLHLEQVIAANVDQVLVVASAERPGFRPDIVDLHLVAASAAGLPAIILLTKADLVPPSRVEEIARRYRKLRLPILRTGLDDDAGLERVKRDLLVGKTTVMVGLSGVGKSTLRNRLLPELPGKAPTSPVSEKSGEGRHVTTAATFEPLSPKGFLVDTPGIRELRPWGVSGRGVQRHFPEFAEIECRFSDCRHVTEPGCGVLAAVERGEATEERLASLLSMMDEL